MSLTFMLQVNAAACALLMGICPCAGPAESQHDLQSEVRGVIPRVLEYLFRSIKHQETTVCNQPYRVLPCSIVTDAIIW